MPKSPDLPPSAIAFRVEVKARLFRQYPLGSVASHAIGYIGRITDRDLGWIEEMEKQANYKGTDHIGKNGLEQHYEFELHGETGYEEVEIDAGGRALRSLETHSASFRQQSALTLDVKLQQITEQAFGERKGALVAIDPSTGGILALVSNPTYDPNLFVDGITPDNWKELNDHPSKPMVNRAINGAYPPGSTFKPFMALAALEMGKRTAATRRSATPVSSISATTISATTRRAGTARSTCTSRSSLLRHLLLHPGQRHGHRQHRQVHGPTWLGPAHRHRPRQGRRQRIERRAALAGMEEAALQESRSSRNGMPAKRFPSASARATTPTRRSSSPRRLLSWPTTG
jgi:hypothetical protein